MAEKDNFCDARIDADVARLLHLVQVVNSEVAGRDEAKKAVADTISAIVDVLADREAPIGVALIALWLILLSTSDALDASVTGNAPEPIASKLS